MCKKLSAIILFLVSFATFDMVKATYPEAPMTVSAEWLAEHINDNNLVLLHVGDRGEYDKGHIPGAQFISLRDISVDGDGGKLSLQLPPADQLRKAFENFGVSNASRVIVYFGKDWITPTTRVYFTLDYLGLAHRTSILDGGMPAWTAAGKTLTAEVKKPAKGTLRINPKQGKIAGADWLKTQLNKSGMSVVDARTPNFYDGTSVGNKPRGGHILGAKSIPYSSIITDDVKFKSDAELQKLFKEAGVKKGDTVITYCHIGQQASLVYFAARRLGFNAKLYDGSFEEWSERSDLPVEDPKKDERAVSIQFAAPDWVAARSADSNTRIIDVRNNVYDYFVGHVPNAVHLADAAMRAPRGGYPTQYLDTWFSGRLLAQAGVKKDDRVILYSEGTSVLGATMMAYILERLGHKQIFIMNGGWADYNGKFPVAKEYPKYETGGYDIWDNRTGRATLEDVKNALGKENVIFVDARPADNYTGEVTTWVRNGHIPGAVNVTWRALTDADNAHKLKPVNEIRKIFEDAGVTKDKDVIVYCGTSREASLEYVVLKHLLGYPNVRLYEGSWAEYAAHADMKVETGAGKKLASR